MERMYDELVKRLRSYDGWALNKTLDEAADAIEELQGTQMSATKWIPVTEELPIRGDRVICFGDNGINIVDFVCGDKWCAEP